MAEWCFTNFNNWQSLKKHHEVVNVRRNGWRREEISETVAFLYVWENSPAAWELCTELLRVCHVWISWLLCGHKLLQAVKDMFWCFKGNLRRNLHPHPEDSRTNAAPDKSGMMCTTCVPMQMRSMETMKAGAAPLCRLPDNFLITSAFCVVMCLK